MLRAFLLVGIGGFIGSISRYAVNLVITKYIDKSLPYATFIVNIVGCFIIGMLFGLVQRGQLSNNYWLVFATGFCGAFTTFSTFALENNTLFADKQSTTALVYTLLSFVVGIVLCRLGIQAVS